VSYCSAHLGEFVDTRVELFLVQRHSLESQRREQIIRGLQVTLTNAYTKAISQHRSCS